MCIQKGRTPFEKPFVRHLGENDVHAQLRKRWGRLLTFTEMPTDKGAEALMAGIRQGR